MSPAVSDHARDAHSMTPSEYRNNVLRRVMAEWPRPITPQILRGRMAAFKEELCDANYVMEACACCAREKRRAKLRHVVFPSPCAEQPPDWLPFNAKEWLAQRDAWYKKVDALLNVDEYISRIFHADRRVEEAERDLKTTRDGRALGPIKFSSEAAATAWLRRVKKWRRYLKETLRSDSVPAPGDPNQRWLLYFGKDRDTARNESDANGLACYLCKKCCTDFASSKVVMPLFARANGMWCGPEPKELAVLTYAERKVIQLGRLYISVKRVFLNPSSYARTRRDETPRYHERNVVAYPSNLDAVKRILGIMPDDLVKTLVVQFVGSDRSALRHEPSLSVSVSRLRDAFHWLSCHCWPWMEATKYEEVIGFEDLGSQLEALLDAYKCSIGGHESAVPAHLIQAATRIADKHAPMQRAGPADAVASGSDDEGPQNTSEQVVDDCAASIDCGTDEFDPLQLWDRIMKEYCIKVKCEEELEAARRGDTSKDKDALAEQHARAAAAAVKA